MMVKNGKFIKCEICGIRKYFAKWEQKCRKHFYCSNDCRDKGMSLFYSGKNASNYQGGKIEVKCSQCGVKLYRSKYQLNNTNRYYCDEKCMAKYFRENLVGKNSSNFGRKFPESSKRMIKNNPMKSLKTRKKVSKTLKSLFSIPEKCANWQGGWQNKYKCIDCGTSVSFGAERCKSCANTGILNSSFGKCTNPPQWFEYNNFYFRSSWELNFANWCDLSGVKWEYESKTFDLGNTTYTPDFYLPEFDLWIEIKGYWRDNAKKKFKKFKRLYKDINIEIFEKDKLSELGVIK